MKDGKQKLVRLGENALREETGPEWPGIHVRNKKPREKKCKEAIGQGEGHDRTEGR